MDQSTATDVRNVRFAEHDDIFIIREDGDYDNDESSSSSSTNEKDGEHNEESSSSFHDSVVDIRESMKGCVHKWRCRQYWKLLGDSVDDADGEAKDVQRYITAFARVEVDGDVPRGLERQLCRSHHEARKVLADNATFAVLSNDYRLRYESRVKPSDDEVWRDLRNIYKKHSHGAKAFARKVGKADEAAVQRGSLSEEQALHLIVELQERSRAGNLRAKPNRCSSMTEVNKRTERIPKTDSWSSSKRSSRSVDLLPTCSDHAGTSSAPSRTSPKKDKSFTKRRAPFRVPSMPIMLRDKTAHEDHAADLFHEVDKKGKTKRSSRWRSFKKRLSKSAHREKNIRSQ